MNKKNIFICFFSFLVLFSLPLPFSAFAYAIPTGSSCYTVAKDNGLTKKYNVVYEYDGEYYLLAFGGTPILGAKDGKLKGKSKSADFNWWLYKFDNKNAYKTPTNVNTGYFLKGGTYNKGFNISNVLFTDINIYGMNDTADDVTEEIIYKPGSYKSNTSTGSGGSVSGNNKLSDIINNSMLQNVLAEVVAVLPIVMPVLITFISIRKGLAFVLSSLRSA